MINSVARTLAVVALATMSSPVQAQDVPLPESIEIEDFARRYDTRNAEAISPEEYDRLTQDREGWEEVNPALIEERHSLFQVKYFSRRDGDQLVVDYELPYLERIRLGQEVIGIDFIGNSPFRVYTPTINFLVNNPRDTVLALNEAAFHIRDSELDARPILVIREDRNILDAIPIYNFGWAMLEGLELDLGVASADRFRDADLHSRGYTHSAKQLEIEESLLLGSVSAILPDELKGSSLVTVYGRFRYFDGQQTIDAPFRTLVSMRNMPERYVPSSKSYSLRLEAGRDNYTEIIPLSQSISPNDSDRFDVTIISDKSADYVIDVDVIDTDGNEIEVGKLDISYFRPRLDNPRISSPHYHQRVPQSAFGGAFPDDRIFAITWDPTEPSSAFVFFRGSGDSIDMEQSDVMFEVGRVLKQTTELRTPFNLLAINEHGDQVGFSYNIR